MRITLSILFALMVSMVCRAAKADPEPFSFKQSDGTELMVFTHGDEYGYYNTTADGALILMKRGDYYIAKVGKDGLLKPTNLLAHNANHRSAEEEIAIKAQDRNGFHSQFVATTTDNRRREPITSSTYFPHKGTPKVLVVLVDFQDSIFHWSNTKEIFDAYLNADTLDPALADGTLAENYSSVAGYFKEMSRGLFCPQFDVVGPIRMPNNINYYANGRNDNISLLVNDAVAMLKDSVDFTQYDLDHNGYVDLTYFICASYSASSNSDKDNQLFWPKVTTASCSTGQGVSISKVGISCELNKKPTTYPTPHVSGIGLFCHEFSHTMGLPDLYATTSTPQMLNQTFEYWDLMDSGEYTKNGLYPNEYSAWERECFGWIEIETLTTDTTLSLKPLSQGGKAYRVYPEGEEAGKHYYLLENVQKVGCNASVLGHGMLVYDITYNGQTMTPNNGYTTQNIDGTTCYYSKTAMTLVPADGFIPISYQVGENIYDGEEAKKFTSTDYRNSHYADPYPGTEGVTEVRSECTDIYKKSSKYYYSTKTGYTGKPITGITEAPLDGDSFNSITLTFGSPEADILPGDANGDKKIDVSDITAIAAYILGRENEGFCQKNADVNGDNKIDVSDITGTAAIILNGY